MRYLAVLLWCVLATPLLHGDVGDPQIKTDHPWYPGELAMSTFPRLAATQAAVYQRVTGREVESDEDKALASWYWRNLHYAHCQEGVGDYFDNGFAAGQWNREYWHGLFAHGMSLCGTTHCQWTAEMRELLGHCRSRCTGVTGHNSFEVLLQGGPYGEGSWALLDHDVSTVIFGKDERRLLSIDEVRRMSKQIRDNDFFPDRQRGWRIAGLHEKDVVDLYDDYSTTAYLAGYAGPPPTVHLRRGETLRRYVHPGLDDGSTFVYWGLNRMQQGIPGPQRDRTWVNQPENMYRASRDAGSKSGRVRFANAVYTYQPRFTDQTYREGIADESEKHMTFQFFTPFVIGATPANNGPWSIYEDGCKNGLVVSLKANCQISVSTDCGTNWDTRLPIDGSVDFTDAVKGHQQYWLRLHTNAESLRSSQLKMTTVCQMNAAVIPRLKSGANQITYQAGGRAIYSAGPNRDQANAHVVEGDISAPKGVVLRLKSPRGQAVDEVFAASHNQSGNPPDPNLAFAIEYRTDAKKAWRSIVGDWKIKRRAPEPEDQWSQSFTYGSAKLDKSTDEVLVRFSNTGRKTYRRVEAHVAYKIDQPSAATVTFAWTENGSDEQRVTHRVHSGDQEQTWTINASGTVDTKWVEIAVP